MTINTGTNLVIGSGIGRLALQNPATGLYGHFFRIGNITVMNSSAEVEKISHYDSEHAAKANDINIVMRTTPMLSFTIDELSPENQAFSDYAILEKVTQAATDNNVKVFTDVVPGCYLPLDKKYVGTQALAYDGGTFIFAVGEVVSGATAEGTVVQVIGDATSGVLYLKLRNAAAFVDDEAITGDGTGAAVANGADYFLGTAVSVYDTAVPGNFLVAGVDYTVESSAFGSILIKTGGAVDGVTVKDLTFTYANEEKALNKINGFSNTSMLAKFWFTSDNTHGSNLDFITRAGQLSPTGERSYIGEEIATIQFEYAVYPDYDNFPESPFWEKFIH